MTHPDIFMPSSMEIHFFDRHYDNGIQWYEAIFSGRREKAVGEATPAYFYFDHIPGLIHNLLPDAKLIVSSLRNPVDRAYSHYWNLVAKARAGDENYGISFEDKIRKTPRLITEGMYLQRLEKYLELFPRENILVLLYDDLEKDPDSFLRTVYSFLGVDTGHRSPVIANKVNAANTKMGKSRQLYFAYRIFMRLGLFGIASRLERLNTARLPEMAPETRRELLEKHYHEDICGLESPLNRDLGAWKRL